MKNVQLSALFVAAAFSLPAVADVGAVHGGLATITDLSGVVLVSEGQRFSTAEIGSGLVRGSRVLTMEDASATVTYGDGCRLQLSGNTMAVLRDTDECANGSVQSEAVSSQYASLGASAAAVGAASSGGAASTVAAVNSAGAIGAPALPEISAAGMVAGVAAVGVAGWAIFADDDNSDFFVSGE